MFWLALIHIGLAVPGDVAELWVAPDGPKERALLQTLPLGFAEGVDGPWLRMDADPEGLIALQHSGLRWRHAQRTLMPPSAYHSPDAMVEALEVLAEDHPDRVSLADLGWSVEGRQIVGVRISNTGQAARQWRIAGAHHGDETVSAELSLAVAEHLATTEDPALDEMLWNTAIWVIPHINPDGIARLDRYNSNRVDLNRNYEYEWSSTEFRPGSAAFSEPETRNLRALSAWEPFGAGLSIHAGATNLGWVWNYTTVPSPDAAVAEALASAYEEGCEQSGFYITNGAEWYITNGDTTDWAYGRHGTLDYTLEVSGQKNPASSQMARSIADHLPAVMDTLAWPWWIQGEVVDSSTGRGIPATITIGESGWPLQSGPSGYFSHPTGEGAVSLNIGAPGYEVVTLEASASDAEPLRIALERRTTIVSTPVPAVLDRHGDGRFTLDLEVESVSLRRPGEADVLAAWDGDAWQIDAGALSPGPWTIITEAGVIERSLFISSEDDAVTISHIARLEAGRWVVTGSGFGRGTQGWGIWGEDRAVTRVQVDVLAEDQLEIQHDGMGLGAPPVDLLLLSNGRQLVLHDIGSTEDGDTGESEDTGRRIDTGTEGPDSGLNPDAGSPGDESDFEQGKLTTCACTTAAGYPAPWLLVTLLPWVSRRRLR